MNRIPLILFIILFFNGAMAQNLVSNPGFDQFTQCPTSNSQMTGYCTGWTAVGTPTPDYFNSCATGNAICGVPLNMFGIQTARSGNGYIGVYTYAGSVSYKEIVQGSLTSRLQLGGEYEASWYVALSDTSGHATDDIGILFMGGNVSTTTQLAIDSPYGPVTNKQDWTRLSARFIADNNYNTIRVGGFLNTQTMTRIQTPPGQNYSYYYIDDVEVKLISDLFLYFRDSALCVGDTIRVPFNVKYPFLTGNTFTLQLSDATGSFNSPINLAAINTTTTDTFVAVIPLSLNAGAGYRLRVVSTSPSLISPVSKKIGIGNIIPEKPVAFGTNPVCSDDTLFLSATTTTPGVSWFWVGPNSYWSDQQNPVIINPNPVGPGFYYVQAYIYGCESRDTVPVTALRAPMIPYASGTTSVCEGDSIKLSVSTNYPGTNYSWVGPDNFSASVQYPKIAGSTALSAGSYVVTVDYGGCTKKDTLNVSIKPLPVFTAANNGPICTNDTLELTPTGHPQGTTFSWTGPGSYSVSATIAKRMNAIAAWSGDYIAKATLVNCVWYDTTTAVVYPVPDTPVATSNSPACVGGDILLSSTTIPGATYYWSGPGLYYGLTQNSSRINAVPGDGGNYVVTAYVNGCPSVPDTTWVNVTQGPTVTIYPNPGNFICPHWKLSFAAVAQNGGTNPVFQWYKNGVFTGHIGTTYNVPSVSSGDSFYVRMTAGTACNTPISSKQVKITYLPVDPSPTITITATPGEHVWPYVPVTFRAKTNMAGANPGYQWKRNGKDISGAIDSVYTSSNLLSGDTICCLVSSNLLCANPRDVLSNCMVMNIDLGVDPANTSSNAFELYPNPNNGNFTIKGSAIAGETIAIEIYNHLGQLVSQDKFAASSADFAHDITMQNAAAGIYHIRLVTGSGVVSRKITVQ